VSLEAHGRDGGEVEAIQVDLYLASLLTRRPVDPTIVDPALALTAQRLQAVLPRFHPSFVFEERLAQRLRTAASGTSTDDAGVLVPFERRAAAGVPDRPAGPRPVVLGGVITSAALSLAGAAYVAWRLRRPAGPVAVRAVRAVARSRVS
jgi:hypothetical protein